MYSPLPDTAVPIISALGFLCLKSNHAVQLSLNSFGSSRRSFMPSANEGLYGLPVAGLTFSSVVVSVALLTSFLDVNGILKGAIACSDEEEVCWFSSCISRASNVFVYDTQGMILHKVMQKVKPLPTHMRRKSNASNYLRPLRPRRMTTKCLETPAIRLWCSCKHDSDWWYLR